VPVFFVVVMRLGERRRKRADGDAQAIDAQ